MGSPVILLAEDRQDDVLILRKALEQAFIEYPLQVVTNGEEAIAYLSGMGKFSDRSTYPIPDLLLLDLKMPMKDGFQVLQWVRAQPCFQKLPVLILTSSEDVRDMKTAYQLGANSFILKPISLTDARHIGDFLPSAFYLPNNPGETQATLPPSELPPPAAPT